MVMGTHMGLNLIFHGHTLTTRLPVRVVLGITTCPRCPVASVLNVSWMRRHFPEQTHSSETGSGIFGRHKIKTLFVTRRDSGRPRTKNSYQDAFFLGPRNLKKKKKNSSWSNSDGEIPTARPRDRARLLIYGSTHVGRSLQHRDMSTVFESGGAASCATD